MAVNRGLGKGLSALFSDTDAEYENSSLQNENYNNKNTANNDTLTVAIDKLFANSGQPRKNFDQTALEELASSIKEHGIIQPILVCPKNNGYMIIAGERRYRAGILAGLKEIPVIVKNYTDRDIKEIALIENLQREDLNPIEAGYALKQLMEEYNLTQEDLSKKIGKSRPAIANLLRLLTLSPKILDMVRHKKITEGHARCLIRLNSEEAISIAENIVQKGLSVRDAEKMTKTTDTKSFKAKPDNSFLSHSRELKDLVLDMQRVFGTKV